MHACMYFAINCGGKTYQECSSCDVHKLFLGGYSPRLRQSSFFNMSLTDALIAALRLAYIFALTSSSSPSK